MGLESIELVMDCEDTFGISIPDDEASKMLTMGDLFALIRRLLGQRLLRGKCTSASAFWRLRKGLMKLGIERRRIRPSSIVDELVPISGRRRSWRILSGSTELRLPPLKVCFNDTRFTVRDLVYSVLIRDRERFSDTSALITDEEIWRILCALVSEQMGVEPDKLHANTRFVEDLGMG